MQVMDKRTANRAGPKKRGGAGVLFAREARGLQVVRGDRHPVGYTHFTGRESRRGATHQARKSVHGVKDAVLCAIGGLI
jgi:hypothetical protein